MFRRTIPRDLFNESKLLKCYGQLSLLILDGNTDGIPLQLDHDDTSYPGFDVEMDGHRGHIYCSNLKLYLNDEIIHVGTIINSKDTYPMVYVTKDEIEGEVFDENGRLSEEFKQYLRGHHESS